MVMPSNKRSGRAFSKPGTVAQLVKPIPHSSEKNWIPRLTNGGSRCDGRVEIYYNRSWGRVQDNLWDINDANVTCRELGCGYAISAYNSSKYGESEGPVWVNEVACQGNESQLQMCNSLTLNPFLDDSDGVGVLCSEHLKLRLTGGGSPCAGRVEVYYSGAWGSVCDDSWDLADAQVVCRQLGCGNALETKLFGHCGKSSDPMWLDELSCSGDESFLWQCPSAPWGEHDCSHQEDAMVMCSEHKELQLVNGKHRCEGRVEVFYNGSWGTVCSESLDEVDAEIICKQLQCGLVQKIMYDAGTFGEGSGNIWLDEVECNSQELTLWQCQSDPWGEHNCKHREDAGVVCSEQQLRLVGRNSSCSGRVEILSNNSWGTVCDDSWDLADANVVCRQLGCGSALSAAGGAAFAQGDGVIWLDEVKCTGSESFLSDCGSSPLGQHDCDHKEDAGVICSRQKGKVVSIPAAVCITLGSLFVCELIALGALTRRKSLRGHVIFDRDSPVGIYDAIYQEVESIQRSEVSSQIERSGEVCFEDAEDGATDIQYSYCQLPYDSDEFLNVADNLRDRNESNP
ncbi:antigen WC1.1-like [Pristis pectinata]|uniref:antigen WC1.1-like n=1 Tax=Pristis pectinata TaxID=685728 RepID=UPI00223D455C|nr:antigen WC1.1-like [Pristis pectinata]